LDIWDMIRNVGYAKLIDKSKQSNGFPLTNGPVKTLDPNR
jgi:hypothetical protein